MGLILVGDPTAIRKELSGIPVDDLELEIAPASDVIRMDENPSLAVRSRAEASINVACRLVQDGRAQGVLTMGHTGAGMVAALFNFGRIPGVERPAVIVPLLGLCEGLFLLDVGANADVRPDHLLQFAQMGSAYAEFAGGIPNPRVGLLSNGSEPNKGSKIVREAYPLLSADGRLNFIGNVEAHTIFTGQVNVVVADGFAGNVLLKASEGIVATLLGQVESSIRQLPPGAAAQVVPKIDALKARNHYATYGAATLLGVQFPMFIGHGRSKAGAVCSAMATAKRMIAADIVGKIRSVYSKS
jgi:glycerol-3-phosphate acyltransferase PlsX